MKNISLLAFSVLLLLSSVLCQADNSAAVPTIRAGDWWMQLHHQYVEQAVDAGTHGIKIAFYGDSLTQFWMSTGLNVWKKRIAPLQVDNFGIGGDRTQHLLWRIENGELSDFHPAKIVLLIGTNNFNADTDAHLNANTNDEIVEAVRVTLHEMLVRQPQAEILLLSLTPRGLADDPTHARVVALNEQLKGLASSQVKYIDIYSSFADAQGLCRADLFLSDHLHYTEAGYNQLADILVPLLK